MTKNKVVELTRPTGKEHHLLLEYPANQFFAPIERAKVQYSAPRPTYFRSFMSTTACVGLAFTAAALAIEPSKKYAESEHRNPIFYQLSNVLTASMINLYGINCLIDELHHGKSVRFIMILSMILGIVSTLPIFFMQQIEQEHQSFVAMMLAIAITVGSIPLQILGFLEFCQIFYPHLQRFYWCYVNVQQPSVLSEWEERDAFLKKLDLGLEYCIVTNQMHNPEAITSHAKFIKTLLTYGQEQVIQSKEASLYEKTILMMSGFVGIILAETVNVAFIKATFDSFAPRMNMAFAGMLTCCVTFPVAVLSAEFGFNATHALLQPLLLFMQTCKIETISGSNTQAISPFLGALRTLFCLVISSCSFAASVQFNRDLLKHQVSSLQMAILNDFTILGVLLFNNYVLNHVCSHYLIAGLTQWGNVDVHKKAKFYQFSQTLLTEYRKMNPSMICDGLNNKLLLPDGYDASENQTFTY